MNEKMNNRFDGSGVKSERLDHAVTTDWESALMKSMSEKPIPEEVQARLDRTYAALRQIPQQMPPRTRRFGRGAIAAIAVAAMTLFAGVAFAASNLIQIGTGSTDFFDSGKNLPVFSSMEAGAKALSADVSQTIAMDDGTTMTLDSVSCDRNVANLYVTLTREGGFDLNDLTNYEGSEEGEWSRVQNAIPLLTYRIADRDGEQSLGSVRRLDAYLDDDKIKCLMRITPDITMPEQVQIDIAYFSQVATSDTAIKPAFSVGLDMTDIAAPRELGSQDVVFNTSQGEKTLGIERFTASDLATVMVARNQDTSWTDAEGQDVSGWSSAYIHPALLKITDDLGNVLQPVDPGDGNGYSAEQSYIVEYANLDSAAQSVTFTPILANDAQAEEQRLQRKAAFENGTHDSVQENVGTADVAQAGGSGAKIYTSSLGGYEITSWDVQDETVTIMLSPFGWNLDVPELIPSDDVPVYSYERTNTETGEAEKGVHTAIQYHKWNYATGEVAQIMSYYNANASQLEALHTYEYAFYPDWYFTEDAHASKVISFF